MSKTPATATSGTLLSSTPHPYMRPLTAAQDGVHPAYYVTPQQHHQYLANLAVKRDLNKDFNVGASNSGNTPTYRVYDLTGTPYFFKYM